VPGHFLKAKQGYTVRKSGKRYMDIVYCILISAGIEIREQKEVPASGVTIDERARSKNCVMGPSIYFLF
jgi:hypothetical protein